MELKDLLEALKPKPKEQVGPGWDDGLLWVNYHGFGWQDGTPKSSVYQFRHHFHFEGDIPKSKTHPFVVSVFVLIDPQTGWPDENPASLIGLSMSVLATGHLAFRVCRRQTLISSESHAAEEVSKTIFILCWVKNLWAQLSDLSGIEGETEGNSWYDGELTGLYAQTSCWSFSRPPEGASVAGLG